MISFDTEDNSAGYVYIINFYDGLIHTTFHHSKYKTQNNLKQAAIDFIYNSTEKLFVAHNLEYDLINIFYPSYLEFLNMYYSSRLLYATLKHKRKKFIDSFNFTFSALKNLGTEINLEKLDNTNFDNIDYCRRDCEIVHVFMSRFIDQIENEFNQKIKSTIAGTAFNIFKNNFCEKNIFNVNINDELLKAYHGGRCECFGLGNFKDVYQVDVNSMYPVCMLEKFPIREALETKKPISSFFISRVKIKIKKETMFPVIPFRSELLLFPVGNFETWLTSVELESAKKDKQIESIKFLHTFNFMDMDFIFTDFVQYFYRQRETYKKSGNKFMSSFYKRILNSTYGRFALKSEIQYFNGDNENFEPVILNIPKKDVNFSIPIFITAYARVRLFNLIKKIQRLGFIPLYCDTDSVFFTGKGDLTKLPVTTKLGDLSMEKYSSAVFHNVKAYNLTTLEDSKIFKQKGIPKDNRKEFQETGKTTYKKPIKLRQSFHGIKGYKANEWINFEVEKKTEYKKRTCYTHPGGYMYSRPIEL